MQVLPGHLLADPEGDYQTPCRTTQLRQGQTSSLRTDPNPERKRQRERPGGGVVNQRLLLLLGRACTSEQVAGRGGTAGGPGRGGA